MSKMPSVQARDVIRVAEQLGFVFCRQSGSHAIYRRQSDMRRVVIPIHKSKDLRLGTLRVIINTLGLTPQEFAARL